MKTISDHILDIVQNSVKAGATLIEIIVREKWNDDLYTLEIRDDGCGMDSETAARALEPFFTSRTTRKVGLGLPLLRQNAMQTGGSVAIDSEPGRGTAVTARFGYSHVAHGRRLPAHHHRPPIHPFAWHSGGAAANRDLPSGWSVM